MLEKEILKLLKQISKQLEDISQSQDQIKRDIKALNVELSSFEEYTLKSVEEKIQKAYLTTSYVKNMLN